MKHVAVIGTFVLLMMGCSQDLGISSHLFWCATNADCSSGCECVPAGGQSFDKVCLCDNSVIPDGLLIGDAVPPKDTNVPPTCTPVCTEKECGDDGCGGTCGACSGGALFACIDFKCVCQPVCYDKQCGDDGCGGQCGECLADTETCVNGLCQSR